MSNLPDSCILERNFKWLLWLWLWLVTPMCRVLYDWEVSNGRRPAAASKGNLIRSFRIQIQKDQDVYAMIMMRQCTPRVPRQGATFYIFIPPSTSVTTVTHEHYYSNSTTTNYHHRNMALLALEHSTVQFKAQLRCFLHLDAGQDHLGHLGLKGRSTLKMRCIIRKLLFFY